MIEGKVNRVTIMNVYTPNNELSTYMKQKMTGLKGKTEIHIWVGIFNISLSNL